MSRARTRRVESGPRDDSRNPSPPLGAAQLRADGWPIGEEDDLARGELSERPQREALVCPRYALLRYRLLSTAASMAASSSLPPMNALTLRALSPEWVG